MTTAPIKRLLAPRSIVGGIYSFMDECGDAQRAAFMDRIHQALGTRR